MNFIKNSHQPHLYENSYNVDLQSLSKIHATSGTYSAHRRDGKRFSLLIHVNVVSRKKVFSVAGTLLRRGIPMLDVVMIALGLGFFALSIGYVILCDRL